MKYSYLLPQLRKSYRTPEFPPKRLHNTSRKVLEQRRQGHKSIENILTCIASCISRFLAKTDDEIFPLNCSPGPRELHPVLRAHEHHAQVHTRLLGGTQGRRQVSFKALHFFIVSLAVFKLKSSIMTLL